MPYPIKIARSYSNTYRCGRTLDGSVLIFLGSEHPDVRERLVCQLHYCYPFIDNAGLRVLACNVLRSLGCPEHEIVAVVDGAALAAAPTPEGK